MNRSMKKARIKTSTTTRMVKGHPEEPPEQGQARAYKHAPEEHKTLQDVMRGPHSWPC